MGPLSILVFTVLLLWLLLSAIVAFSDREQGSRKGLWVLGVIFTSWLSFLAFMLATSRRNDQAQANTS